MAVLGELIDTRTLAGLAAEGTVSFAHGLPAAPHFVVIQRITSIASNVSASELNCLQDATNITIQNSGEGTSPAYRVISVVLHSTIQ